MRADAPICPYNANLTIIINNFCLSILFVFLSKDSKDLMDNILSLYSRL